MEAKQRYWTGGRLALAGGVLVVAWLLGLCAGAVGANQTKTGAAPLPVASAPVATPTPTPVAKPSPLALSGQGSKVVEFDLPKGSYRLSWTAKLSGQDKYTSQDNFIVHLEGAESSGLINELPPNPSSGESFVRLGGGHYALDVKASVLSWSITFTAV